MADRRLEPCREIANIKPLVSNVYSFQHVKTKVLYWRLVFCWLVILSRGRREKKKMFRFQGLTQRGEEAYVIARWRAMAMISAAAKGYG